MVYRSVYQRLYIQLLQWYLRGCIHRALLSNYRLLLCLASLCRRFSFHIAMNAIKVIDSVADINSAGSYMFIVPFAHLTVILLPMCASGLIFTITPFVFSGLYGTPTALHRSKPWVSILTAIPILKSTHVRLIYRLPNRWVQRVSAALRSCMYFL